MGASKSLSESRIDELYSDFIGLLEKEDKGACIEFSLSALEKKKLDIVQLYSRLLAPSLNSMVCKYDEDTCIWKEHVRSSIIRAIIESCYSYVLKEKERKHKGKPGRRVLVVCPTEELHELGARMVSDYFVLAGDDVEFVGANTPLRVIRSAVQSFRPNLLAISVTNHYNLFAAKKVISAVRESELSKLRIVVGGSAFKGSPDTAKEIGADLELQTYDDIIALKDGD